LRRSPRHDQDVPGQYRRPIIASCKARAAIGRQDHRLLVHRSRVARNRFCGSPTRPARTLLRGQQQQRGIQNGGEETHPRLLNTVCCLRFYGEFRRWPQYPCPAGRCSRWMWLHSLQGSGGELKQLEPTQAVGIGDKRVRRGGVDHAKFAAQGLAPPRTISATPRAGRDMGRLRFAAQALSAATQNTVTSTKTGAVGQR